MALLKCCIKLYNHFFGPQHINIVSLTITINYNPYYPFLFCAV